MLMKSDFKPLSSCSCKAYQKGSVANKEKRGHDFGDIC